MFSSASRAFAAVIPASLSVKEYEPLGWITNVPSELTSVIGVLLLTTSASPSLSESLGSTFPVIVV